MISNTYCKDVLVVSLLNTHNTTFGSHAQTHKSPNIKKKNRHPTISSTHLECSFSFKITSSPSTNYTQTYSIAILTWLNVCFLHESRFSYQYKGKWVLQVSQRRSGQETVRPITALKNLQNLTRRRQ